MLNVQLRMMYLLTNMPHVTISDVQIDEETLEHTMNEVSAAKCLVVHTQTVPSIFVLGRTVAKQYHHSIARYL